MENSAIGRIPSATIADHAFPIAESHASAAASNRKSMFGNNRDAGLCPLAAPSIGTISLSPMENPAIDRIPSATIAEHTFPI